MKRIRIVGLALVAVFAMSVVASSASAAGPVFYTKAEVGGAAPSHIKFTATIGAAFLEGQKSKSKISCSDTAGTGAGAVGETVSAKVAENNVTTFTGCKSGELPCTSTGASEGVIVTKALKAFLGGTSATVPGERLYSQSEGRGGKLAEFECGAGIVKVVVTGSVIGALSGSSGKVVSEGKFSTTQKLTFQEAAGLQKYTIFA
ncbi:MAG TPA: hypothetical protein VH137_01225, partial [Gemmatimonadales bacterium]|nr:hypothetical protein [Gemmatimonadales bacterium]